jgi:hypothetical protein
MVLSKLAERFLCVRHFGVRLQELRLELAKKFLALLFDDRGIRNGVDLSLRYSGRHFGHEWGNAFIVLADGADIQVGRIVQVAFRAR